MSQDSSDKSNYSVDEMMDRLREGGREDSAERELVTREDGSQVIRVKKRKRRTKQKKEEEAKRRKRMAVARTLALIALPLVVGLGIVLLLANYSSAGFLRGVVATVWEKTGSSAKIKHLTPLGTKVTTGNVSLNWPDGNQLDQLRVSDVSGDLSLLSFFTGKLKGEELNAAKGMLVSSNRKDRKITKPKGEALELPGFGTYSCDFFSFYFGAAKSPFRLEGTKVRYIPSDYSNRLELSGGNLQAGSWGGLPLKRGTIEFLNSTIKIVSLRFEEEARHLVVSGDLALSDSLHSLTVEARKGTVGSVAGFEFDKLVDSEIDGSTGTLSFRAWDASSYQSTLSCEPKYFSLRNFAFLEDLEELYGDARFRNFEFELEEGFELVRSEEGCRLIGLDVEEAGALGIRGEIAVVDGSLTGDLEIGLPEYRKVNILRHRREAFFKAGRLEGDFFWFPIELSGTPANPKDNFVRYLEQKGEEKNAEDLFDQLTR